MWWVRVGLSGLVGGPEPPVLKHGPRSVIWVQVRGCKTFKRSESNRYDRPLLGVGQYRPGDSIAESPASEHPDYDPKDCELYLGRMKPGESLVEVRNNADVQIACQIWVKRRKTNRAI